jgi:hypothetical protein
MPLPAQYPYPPDAGDGLDQLAVFLAALKEHPLPVRMLLAAVIPFEHTSARVTHPIVAVTSLMPWYPNPTQHV